MKRPLLVLLALLSAAVMASCSTEEEDCFETICPDGFNNCIQQPCNF